MADSTDNIKPDQKSFFRANFTEKMASVIEGFPPEIQKALTPEIRKQIIDAATQQFTTPGDKSFAKLLFSISVDKNLGAREIVDLADAAVRANIAYYQEPEVERSIRQGVRDAGGTGQQADLVIATAQGNETAIQEARRAINKANLRIVPHQDADVSNHQVPHTRQNKNEPDPPHR